MTPVKKKFRRRGIFLLPNLLTTAALFAGFYSIVAAVDGNFDKAGAAIFIAMVLDGLDGRVARLTNTSTQFGKEYDSLSDMVSFGLAPAVVVYEWGVARLTAWNVAWGRLGWLVAFLSVVAAALRLARFNAQATATSKRFFVGLPSPSAAARVAAFVWLSSELELAGLGGLALAFAVTAAAAVLMVSPFPLLQFQRDQLRRPHTVHVFDRYRIDFYTNCPRSTGRLPDPVQGVRGVGPNLLLMAQVGATAGRRNG